MDQHLKPTNQQISNSQIVFFTGGGSGGHVVPALTLIKELKSQHPDIELHYIGGIHSIERELVKPFQLTYHPIYNGKLRRYFSLENALDFFRIVVGIFQAFFILLKFKKSQSLIFSTGGFVSLPVVIAGKFLRIPIFIHEQTSRVGLANKIASFFSEKIFVSFLESLNYFPKKKSTYSGYPLRDTCYNSEYKDFYFKNSSGNYSLLGIGKPLLFVTGGGNGSLLLNELVKKNLKILTEKFFIFHQVGKNFEEEYTQFHSPNYHSVAFVGEEMIELMKFADITLSRAGAGTVCELMAIGKKSIFVPLKIAQKNEQFHNAKEAEKRLGSIIMTEDELELNPEIFLEKILSIQLPNHRQQAHQENGKNILLKNILLRLQS